MMWSFVSRTTGETKLEFWENNEILFRTLIYNGMYDIILHHTGIEAMIMDLNWSGLDKYKYYEFLKALQAF